MSKLDLGRVGVSVAPGEDRAFLDGMAALEGLGYATIWLAGGPLRHLGQIRAVVEATRQVKVASGIIAVDRFGAAAVAAAYAEIQAAHPGRFVVGLGGAHGPRPLRTLTGYLDVLDRVPPTVPATARILAAIGPRMLRLARERSAGAYPYMVTPDYTSQARSLLGQDATLVVGQLAVLERDPARARRLARGTLGFLTRVGGRGGAGGPYADSLRRMGFADDEIGGLDDRLVDAVVAWGDADTVAARVGEQHAAGADHVALSVIDDAPPGTLPAGQWRQLAAALLR